MTTIASFRAVYFISLMFGIFPYEPVGPNAFRLQKFALWQERFVLSLLIIFRLIIMSLDMTFNFNSFMRTFMTMVRMGNGFFSHVTTIIIYVTIMKFNRSMCTWLTKISRLYSSLKGNSRALLNFNHCTICYSIVFFCATNTVTLTLLWTNAKFINGWIAFSDSVFFVFQLSIQNVYFCGFLIMINLVKMSFARINEAFGEKDLRRAKGSILLKKLRFLREQHLMVADFLDFLQSVFGLQLLIYISWSFLSTLLTFISIVILDFKDAIPLIFWLLYHPCQILPILFICNEIANEAKKSACCMDELQMENKETEIKEEIEIFSLQLQHRPAHFSVCEFFNLNFELVLSTTSIVTTYIIALIQIHQLHLMK